MSKFYTPRPIADGEIFQSVHNPFQKLVVICACLEDAIPWVCYVCEYFDMKGTQGVFHMMEEELLDGANWRPLKPTELAPSTKEAD